MISEERHGGEVGASRHRSPADERRDRAGGAADHDVLRRAALEPDRVDEARSERKPASAQSGREPVDHDRQPERHPRCRAPMPIANASRAAMRPRRPGGAAVRAMRRSMSRSYQWFRALEPPEQRHMPTTVATSSQVPRPAMRCEAHRADRGDHDQQHDPAASGSRRSRRALARCAVAPSSRCQRRGRGDRGLGHAPQS